MAVACPSARTYSRRIPEATVLYRVVQQYFGEFLAQVEAGDRGGRLPAFVKEEFEAYLGCGLLSRGCLHVRCEQCGDEMVVAFSCKGRFCPSCGGRRMTELAAHLVDRVIPDVPVRQWVLSLPWSLRYQLAFDATLCRDVLAVFIRVVFGWLRRRAASRGIRDSQCGAVTVIQRFGSSLNLNVHLHSIVLDGVFTRSTPTGAPVFQALPAPTDAEVADVLEQVHRRVRRLLRRRGRWPEEESCPSDPVTEQMPLLAEYASASIQGLVASGPRAGHPVRRLRSAAAVVDGAKPRCARVEGFSLHANVAVPAHARERLEHLCRSLLRPPLALERLTESSHGQVVFELPHPRADGATHLLLDPLELIEKLSVLIPPRRFHTLRFHGVLGPAAAWRSEVIPRRRTTAAVPSARE